MKKKIGVILVVLITFFITGCFEENDTINGVKYDKTIHVEIKNRGSTDKIREKNEYYYFSTETNNVLILIETEYSDGVREEFYCGKYKYETYYQFYNVYDIIGNKVKFKGDIGVIGDINSDSYKSKLHSKSIIHSDEIEYYDKFLEIEKNYIDIIKKIK